MTKRKRDKLIKELKEEFTMQPLRFTEVSARDKIKSLPNKLKIVRNAYFGSGYKRDDQVPVLLNEFELNYLIDFLDFINSEVK